MGSKVRFGCAALLLLGAALVLHARGRQEFIPPRDNFSSFPERLGDWTGTETPIPEDVRDVLGAGDFLLRDYRESPSDPYPVELFLAYFPTQRQGDTIHSPKHCLPGGGWFPLESSRISLYFPGQGVFPVNRYLVGNDGQRALVIYWFRARDRVMASEYREKFFLFADSLRFNRSDGSLIRASTTLRPGESAAEAQQRLLSLLSVATPLLDRYIPR